jgi:hypothetical protein
MDILLHVIPKLDIWLANLCKPHGCPFSGAERIVLVSKDEGEELVLIELVEAEVAPPKLWHG